jgi:uncharacterized protein YutE (UPF0331/DUF86 family)
MVDEQMLGTHWLAEHGAIDPGLAERLSQAAGLRNLIAHRYGALDSDRLYVAASDRLDDLLAFCDALIRHSKEPA